MSRSIAGKRFPGGTSSMPWRKKAHDRGTKAAQTVSLYYASDIHGSDVCWRKFLNAGRFYGVDAMIMGGDLTGKAVVPIELSSDGSFRTQFLGEERRGSTQGELDELQEAVRFNGMYPWLASAEEIARHRSDPAARAKVFDEVMQAEFRQWIALADERIAVHGIDVFVMPGNDDSLECDEAIEAAQRVQACEGRVVRVGPHEMISCAYSNPTPWDSPRELDEDDLYKRLRSLADQLEAPASAIFNLHAPPCDSGLDSANEVNSDLTLKYIGGQPHVIPVGSTAVRQIIEEVQPLLALHGHVHESRGEVRIGRTLAINPGSEYNSGHIHGVVVGLAQESVLNYQFVTG
jgi:Icc-related predicted phosphoesterase